MGVDTAVTEAAVESSEAFHGLTGDAELESELLTSDCLSVGCFVLVGRKLRAHRIETRRAVGGEQNGREGENVFESEEEKRGEDVRET